MKACPRCTRAYSPLDIYCGSCGTIRCADEVPALMRRFSIQNESGHQWKVIDRHAGAGSRNRVVGAFLELIHAETFRNCLVATELARLEDAV